MDFVVDKVSEDSFYINILLGLPKQLDKFKKLGVKTRHLTRKLPVSHSDICNWEHSQGILLPEDLRNFYSSTNGFLFTWTYNFGQDKTTIMGRIEINHIEDLKLISGYEIKPDPGIKAQADQFELRLGNSSKLYELVKLENSHKVILVYLNSKYSPTIWVSNGSDEYYFLSDDFTTYFLMSVAHLGIPNWQLLFTPQGVPQWTENMIRLLAPNLLRTRRSNKPPNRICDIPLNRLDLNIFKCLPKNPHGVPRVVEKERAVMASKSPRKKVERERSFTRPPKKSSNLVKK